MSTDLPLVLFIESTSYWIVDYSEKRNEASNLTQNINLTALKLRHSFQSYEAADPQHLSFKSGNNKITIAEAHTFHCST